MSNRKRLEILPTILQSAGRLLMIKHCPASIVNIGNFEKLLS